MTTYTLNGTVFNVGDYVRGYHKGIFQIAAFQPRGKEKPIVELTRVFNENLTPRKGTVECDVSYCTHVTKEMLQAELDVIMASYANAIATVNSASSLSI